MRSPSTLLKRRELPADSFAAALRRIQGAMPDNEDGGQRE